ncbi:MAG: zf-HC2 domain-containing protein [Actinomycetota bacterium]|jgi:predicted anti-sigma-YlaC factor YlaD|nr:zf-HC2 domain-containing protein [Actinomycetota bacterium]
MTERELACKEVVQLVTDYLEASMATESRLQFERHVAVCPPCRGFLAQMRETLRLSGELTEESLSAEGRESLLAAFRDWRSVQ